MRSDWQTKKLGEVCEFHNGLWKGKQSPYINVGVIRNTNFREDGSLDDSDIAYLDVEKKQFSERKLNFGDIILEKSGGGPKQPVGRVIIFNKKEGEYSFSNFTSAIRIKDRGELDFSFLHKFLFYSYISGITETMQSHSTGIRNLNLNAYKDIEAPIPPLSEQKRIVKKLDEVFEKVAKAKEAAEKNLQNAKELFESYLQNVFANPGKEWKEEEIKDISKVGTGATPLKSNKKYYGGNIPWVTSRSTNNYFVSEPDAYITDLALHETNCKLNKRNTLLVAMYGQGKTRGQVSELLIEAATNQAVATVFVNEGVIVRDFVKYFFLYNYESMRKMADGGVQLNLNLNKIKSMRILFPPSQTQQKSIVKRLDALSVETKKLEKMYEQKIVDLEELKKSVLASAFAGKL